MERRTKNQNEQQRAFFIPIFIHSHQFWTYGMWLISRAMKSSNDGQRKAVKSSKKLRRAAKATTDIRAGKAKTGKKKLRPATKGTKSPNGNQALVLRHLHHPERND